jgi:hypothetical protein
MCGAGAAKCGAGAAGRAIIAGAPPPRWGGAADASVTANRDKQSAVITARSIARRDMVLPSAKFLLSFKRRVGDFVPARLNAS